MEILRVENLSFKYPNQQDYALREISFSVTEGEFVVLCGASGCGKTTLLRLLKSEIAPHGEVDGKINFVGGLEGARIGFVSQEPDTQIVTDKVWHELAFGLENQGVRNSLIRRRVAEMANYFGITEWYSRNTDELSGGQKQVLNLASVMVLQPKILLLDEPTAQLDPIAAADFIHTLVKLNRELGITILIAEHRLEDVFAEADKALFLEDGRLLHFGSPSMIVNELSGSPMEKGLPAAARIFIGTGGTGKSPLTVREGHAYLKDRVKGEKLPSVIVREREEGEIAIEAKDIWFRYERESPDVLKGLDACVRQGEVFCVLGGNGAGKTTALNVLSGIDRAYKGKLRIFGKKLKEYKNNSLYRGILALLPQDPATIFVKNTVREDFEHMLATLGHQKDKRSTRVTEIAEQFGITKLLDHHPYDLSGGERQKCALAKLLLFEPKILMLDEPTKGMDAVSKQKLKEFLLSLRDKGVTLFIVTHDVEFAAEIADRCSLFFEGDLLEAEKPNAFFSGNYFYTTAAARITRGIFNNAVLCEEAIELYKTGSDIVKQFKDGQ